MYTKSVLAVQLYIMHNICWQYKCTQSLDSTAEQLTRTFAMLKRAGSYQTFTTSNWCNCFCQQKPPLLRGKQSKPWMSAPPNFSSEAREVFLSLYPLLVPPFLPTKTTTLERCAKWALKNCPLSQEREASLSPYPLLPLQSLPPFLLTKNISFERWAKRALKKCPLHTLCHHFCQQKPPLLRGQQSKP